LGSAFGVGNQTVEKIIPAGCSKMFECKARKKVKAEAHFQYVRI